MWFKNLQLYRLSEPFELSAEALQEQLEAQRFQPCGPQEQERWGWTAPAAPNDERLVFEQDDRLMIAARKEEKLLPASVVNEFLAERVEEVENKLDRKLRKQERDTLRDEVLFDLRPRAFSRTNTFHAYIDPRSRWLIVNSASTKHGEALSVLLRKSLGSLPIVMPHVQQSISKTMTSWLQEALPPPPFSLEDECELRSPSESGGIVRCRQQALLDPEVQGHLQAGKQVVKLSLNWKDRLSLLIDTDFTIKRLRYLEQLQEQRADIETDEDPLLEFSADFTLMAAEIDELLNDLLAAFGGEAEKI